MRIKRKIAPFFFGLTIGLLIGAGVFMFKVGDWFRKARDSAAERITVIEQPVKTVENLHEEFAETAENEPRIDEPFRIKTGKSGDVDYEEVDKLIAEDSKIRIARDELLSVKNVKVIKIADKDAVSDSAAVLAGVKEPASETVQIEFWKTPLNSRGYRFSKNKVMLYGFPDFSNVLVYQVDDSFFLKSSDQVFRLNYSAEFTVPEMVQDPVVLSKLN